MEAYGEEEQEKTKEGKLWLVCKLKKKTFKIKNLRIHILKKIQGSFNMYTSPMNFLIIFIFSQIEPFSFTSTNTVDLTSLNRKEITLKCRFRKRRRPCH